MGMSQMDSSAPGHPLPSTALMLADLYVLTVCDEDAQA